VNHTTGEFMQGYIDGGDLDAPEPSANRSYCYRHSFAVRRAEILRRPINADVSRRNAEAALVKDLGA
jgi:hypothetical protein